jgi:hypothetical protein
LNKDTLSIVRRTKLCCVATDRHGRILDVSPRLLELVAQDLASLVRRPISEALPWFCAAETEPQLVAGRWLSAKPIRLSGALTVWVLIDKTAEVERDHAQARLKALYLLLGNDDVRVPTNEVNAALRAASDLRDLCAVTGLPLQAVLAQLASIL